MATRTISILGGNWNELTTWAEAAVPTKEDDVVATSSSANLTINATAECRGADFTNYTKTLAHNSGIAWNIYGSLTLVSGMVYSPVAARAINFVSTAAENKVTCAGKALGTVDFNGSGGEWLLQDAYKSGGATKLNAGTLDANGQKVTFATFTAAAAAAGSVLNMSSNIWRTENEATTTVFNINNSNLTVNASTSTLQIPFGSNQIINIGNKTLASVTRSNVDFTITHTGATIKTFTMNNSANAWILTLTKSQTLTVENFNVNGVAEHLITIQSSGAGTQATLSKASGVVSCDYLSIKDSKATGGATFYAGAHSTNVSNNEGWKFESPSAGNFFEVF